MMWEDMPDFLPPTPPMSVHKKISFVKSAVRIAGYVLGILAFPFSFFGQVAFVVLIASEVIGVYEEIGEK